MRRLASSIKLTHREIIDVLVYEQKDFAKLIGQVCRGEVAAEGHRELLAGLVKELNDD